jgi:hypothetical protein
MLNEPKIIWEKWSDPFGFSKDQYILPEYENEYYERISYMYKNIQVDIFIPLDGVNDMLISEDNNHIIHYSEIMKMKIMHAYGEHYSRFKHQKDIIHFMNEVD